MTAADAAHRLPDVPTLRARCCAVPAAEALINPSGEYAYHVYSPEWSPTEEVFSVDNGSGDDYAVVFGPAGVYLRFFSHESVMSPWGDDEERPWPGILDTLPAVFRPYVDEPAFTEDGVPRLTGCIWRESADTRWHTGDIDFPENPENTDESDDADGADRLLGLLLEGTAEAFRDWAEDYYERPVDLDAVRRVFKDAA
ncbi:hypothetical protein [Streptomyces sp. VRA16 Mangrove soil]|uniref:hypothetical protein n=1 Tax=Streptomyces sp. VRA16 Mangrove soil TaxID=2817434 RepID=UPI001A9E75EF|nr:hypothetical protein [Streptomyces sp. VRA16 Mangrove soil]MBO1333167.1 hypothetical protein [Streptomyces sp. VRA16 Mangrove soil]